MNILAHPLSGGTVWFLHVVGCVAVLMISVLGGSTAHAEVSPANLQGYDQALILSTGQLPGRLGAQNQYTATIAFQRTEISGREGYVDVRFFDAAGNEIPGNQFQLFDQNGNILPKAFRDLRSHVYPVTAFSQPVTVRMFTGDTREIVSLATLRQGNLPGLFPVPPPSGTIITKPGPSDGRVPGATDKPSNQTGGNQTGGNQTGGNQTGGNQTGGNQTGGGGGNSVGLVPCRDKPCELRDLFVMGRNIFNFLLYTGAIAATLAIVVAGFQYIMSRGDPALNKTAKQHLTLAIIGLGVLLLAYVIVNTILRSLGVGQEFQNYS